MSFFPFSSAPSQALPVGISITIQMPTSSSNAPATEDIQRIISVAQGAFSVTIRTPVPVFFSTQCLLRPLPIVKRPEEQEGPPPPISSVPSAIIATIASHLLPQEQADLALAAAHKQTENVREGIASARLDLLEALSKSYKVRTVFYSITQQQFPSSETVATAREKRDLSKLGKIDAQVAKQIDQNIGKFIRSIEESLRLARSTLSWACRDREIDGMEWLRDQPIQETFPVLYDFNLLTLEEPLGMVNFDAITTKADFLQAARTAPEKLAEITDPIETVSLQSKRMTLLPREIAMLKDLKKLDLRENEIAELPYEIGNCTNLTELDLFGNVLTTLPEEFRKLTLLQELNLRKNKFQSCPSQLASLAELTWLDLSNNPLTITPDILAQFLSLKKLTTLHLSPDQIARCFPEYKGRGYITLHRKNKDEPDLGVSIND